MVRVVADGFKQRPEAIFAARTPTCGRRIFQVRAGSHGAHASDVPDNIMLERVNELRNTDKVGRYFYVVGQHDVARDASFLARNHAFDTPGLVSLRGVVGAKVGAAALSTYNYGQIGK